MVDKKSDAVTISTALDDEGQGPVSRSHQSTKGPPDHLVGEDEFGRVVAAVDTNLDTEPRKPTDEENLIRGGVVIRDGSFLTV